jgi:hypothetical protein
MNTQSNAIPESPLESQVIALAGISTTRRVYWLLRRELWENRSIYVAPLAVAGVILFAFLIGTIASIWEKALRLAPAQQPHKLETTTKSLNPVDSAVLTRPNTAKRPYFDPILCPSFGTILSAKEA